MKKLIQPHKKFSTICAGITFVLAVIDALVSLNIAEYNAHVTGQFDREPYVVATFAGLIAIACLAGLAVLHSTYFLNNRKFVLTITALIIVAIIGIGVCLHYHNNHNWKSCNSISAKANQSADCSTPGAAIKFSTTLYL